MKFLENPFLIGTLVFRRWIYTIRTCFMHFEIRYLRTLLAPRRSLGVFSKKISFTHFLDNYHFRFGMGRYIWTKNLMTKSKLYNSNFFADQLRHRPLRRPERYCKVRKNGIKWQEILSNTINFVWVNLPGQGI